MLGTYEIRAVQRTPTLGKPIASVTSQGGDSGANLHRYSWQLNYPGSAEFSMGLFDAKGIYFKKYTEVQIWHNDNLEWWGVIVNCRATLEGDNPRVVFQCQGVLWYLLRRFMGKANRTNYATNPGFESGTTGWTATGTTFTISTTDFKTGTQAAKLVQGTVGADAHISQSTSITAGGVGELLTVHGYYKISPTGWTGPALENRGLMIERVGAGTTRGTHFDFDEIDSETPRDVWRPATATVHMPPNAAETIRWRGYSPATSGGILWDHITVTKMESLSFYYDDQSLVFAFILQHLQDPVFDKDNVGINWNTPTTGVNMDWHAQFVDHRDFPSILREFTERSNGFDIGMVLSGDGLSRTLNTYYPRKGSLKPQYGFTQNDIVGLTYQEDGERGVTSQVILGEGSGPSREEGFASSIPTGWPVLEDVEAAPTGYDINSLNTLAAERQRVRKNPHIIHATFNVWHKDMSPVVEGDTVPVNIDAGWCQIDGNWRVISKTVAPHKDNITLELNPA